MHRTLPTLLALSLAASCMASGADKAAERLLAPDDALSSLTTLPAPKARHTLVFEAKQGQSGFNLHSYIAYFGGRYWLAWSSAAENEEDPDQHLMFATSADGRKWSEARMLAADPDGPSGPKRWIMRGLFVENGKLQALGALVESADYRNQGKDVVWKNLQLMRFTWDGKAWTGGGVFAANCMNNFPPSKSEGAYLMPCRDSRMQMQVARADASVPGGWRFFPLFSEPPFNRMDEPTLFEAANQSLHLVIRDGSKSGYLLRSVSTDRGYSWSRPVRTNYPDATSKNFVLRLSSGAYALINNPDQKRRDPLTVSFSRDGWMFEHPVIVRQGAQSGRLTRVHGRSPGFQYPHAMEHNGSLWIAYSIAKEDIAVTTIRIADLGWKP